MVMLAMAMVLTLRILVVRTMGTAAWDIQGMEVMLYHNHNARFRSMLLFNLLMYYLRT